MKYLTASVLILASALGGCACVSPIQTSTSIDRTKPEIHGAQSRRDQLIGKWYGVAALRDGGTRAWLMERKADGRFRVEFLIRAVNKKPERSVEVGQWGIAGSIYFTITQGWLDGVVFTPADSKNASFYDAYRVIELKDDLFTYESVETSNVFTVRKVSDDFLLPVDNQTLSLAHRDEKLMRSEALIDW